MKFTNVRLLTGDFDASYQFWRDVMRLPVAYGPDSPGGIPGYAYLTIGDVGVELMGRDAFAAALGEATPATVPTTGRQAVLVLGVDDVDATYADLVGRGARSIAAPVDRPAWGARSAHLADPDGHLIELYTRLAMPDASEMPTI
jgi:lactoylglutathione lyase